MSTDRHSFGAFRYFIVPCEQISLFDTVEEKRAIAVNNFFSQLAEMKKRNWEIKGKKHLLVCNIKLSDDIFVCKFSKETTKTIFKESDDDIENVDEPDYPFVYVIFDTTRQIVLIELKTSVFSSLNQAKEKLKVCFQQTFALYGFEVLFEEITDSSTFWNYISDSYGVYDLTLTLNSPNLFGGFSNTNEMLKTIKNTYNNSQTTIKLSSKNPTITNLTQQNALLNDAIEYASAGGGEWSLTVAAKDAEKRTIKSKHNVRKVAVRKIHPKQDRRDIEADIHKALDRVETILKETKKHHETDS